MQAGGSVVLGARSAEGEVQLSPRHPSTFITRSQPFPPPKRRYQTYLPKTVPHHTINRTPPSINRTFPRLLFSLQPPSSPPLLTSSVLTSSQSPAAIRGQPSGSVRPPTIAPYSLHIEQTRITNGTRGAISRIQEKRREKSLALRFESPAPSPCSFPGLFCFMQCCHQKLRPRAVAQTTATEFLANTTAGRGLPPQSCKEGD